MKRKIITSSKYKKELKAALGNRTFHVEVLTEVVEKLRQDIPLEPKYKDHLLKEYYEGYRDCHIHLDWILVYGKTDTNELKILELVRLNSHYNLF